MGIFDFLKGKSKQTENSKVHPATGSNSSTNVMDNSSTIANENKLQYDHSNLNSFIYNSFETETGEKWFAKYTYDVNIFRPDKSFNEIFKYDIVDIVPEPENPHDSSAVSVRFHDKVIGYLYKGTIQDMVHDFLNRDEKVKAQVQKIDGDSIEIKIFFCKLKNASENIITTTFVTKNVTLEKQKSFVVTLTSNKNEEMQDNISFCDIGDEVDIEYNFDKEQYLASQNFADIGYIPKSKTETIDELEQKGYEFYCTISDIQENDDGKYIVKVEIQPQ